MGTAAPRRGSGERPKAMRVVWRVRDESWKRRAERLDEGEEKEARERDLRYVPRLAAVEESNSVNGELKNMKEDPYCRMLLLQLTQNKLERVNGGRKEKAVLIES